MLDHLHVEDDVEPLARSREVLGGADTIIDIESDLVCMHRRGLDVLLGRVDAHHGRAEPGHGFAEQSAAAADVEKPQAGKGLALEGIKAKAAADLLLDVLQAHGVEDMEHPELAFRVPPFGGHFREFLDL